MTPEELEAVRVKGRELHKGEQFKKAVEVEVERLRKRKAHLIPFKVRLQWPVIIEERYPPKK